MSFCRFANSEYKIGEFTIPKSDVYVIESDWFGIECCGCRLYPEKRIGYNTYSEMIAHLKEHIRAGHTVPDHVIPLLESIIADEGDEVK